VKSGGCQEGCFSVSSETEPYDALRARLKVLAVQHSVTSYLLLHGILRGEDLVVKNEPSTPPYGGRAAGRHQAGNEAANASATNGAARYSPPALVNGFLLLEAFMEMMDWQRQYNVRSRRLLNYFSSILCA
jgi:hypothetical protein